MIGTYDADHPLIQKFGPGTVLAWVKPVDFDEVIRRAVAYYDPEFYDQLAGDPGLLDELVRAGTEGLG